MPAARFIYQGYVQDANGKIVTSASITVHEADTTTLATIYSAASGGSVVTGSVVTSDDNGYFKFYISNGDYDITRIFDITISKANYQTTTLEDVNIVLYSI